MKTTQEMLEVMQAYERGENIDIRLQYSQSFSYAGSTVVFDWLHNDYRIAEKPKKKVKMWLWLLKTTCGKYCPTAHYYAEPPNYVVGRIIGKIESSMIEVEE